jgi:peroxiredoxin
MQRFLNLNRVALLFGVIICFFLISAVPVKSPKPFLKTGDKAPDFRLLNDSLQPVILSDELKKGPVVLSFYIFDFTEGCHRQMDEYENLERQYASLGLKVFGVSVDSPFSHQAWKKYEKIKLTLLSDFNKETIKSYGVYTEKLDEWKGVSRRALFLIGKDNRIKYAWVSPNSRQLPDIQPLVKVLEQMAGKTAPAKVSAKPVR